MVMAHGPGVFIAQDFLAGGCIGTGCLHGGYFRMTDLGTIKVTEALWMSSSCGRGNIRFKGFTASSLMPTFLKQGGAVFIGNTILICDGLEDTCFVPRGDSCIGSFYTEIAKRFTVGERVGDAYMEGKNYYINNYDCTNCGQMYNAFYHYQVNCFYGDSTLKIKMW